MRYVTVRVVDSGGRPQSNIRVAIYVNQFAASGMKDPQYTNSDGETEFALDIDTFAEISVYVDGQERVKRGSVQAMCKIIL